MSSVLSKVTVDTPHINPVIKAIKPKSALHEYQQSAIDWMYEHDSWLALMPVGAGKSISAMTALQELMLDGVIKRPIIFAPLRVAQMVWGPERYEWEHTQDIEMVLWGGEPSSWADSLWKKSRLLWGQRTNAENRLPKIVDTIERRKLEDKLAALIAEERRVNKEIRKTEPPAYMHVTSYENTIWLCELYKPGESPFDAWIFDEGGKLKNPKSPRFKAIRKHTALAKVRGLLNATPAPEGFFDLFAQVNVVDGGKLWGKSAYAWRQQHFYPTDYNQFNWRLQPWAKDKLLKDLNTIAFKVDEKDLSYTETMMHNQILVDMPPKARELYVEMEKHMAVEIEGHGDIVALSAASGSMKLRQLTSGFIYDDEGKAHMVHDAKLNAISDLIDAMQGEPLLLAYEFGEELEMIRRVFKNVPYLGQGVSSVKAKENVDRWNKRELPVMALHWLSAGHGVNLQAGGSHVGWVSLPWALEGYIQLNGRVNRQGQTRACYGHHIVVRDSSDQRVSDALIEKDVTQRSVIDAIRRL